MTRKFFISTAIASAIAFASAPAMANQVHIDQFGFGNAAGGAQAGVNNTIGVFQDGIFNNSISQQTGVGNLAVTGQQGFNNDADILQNGNFNQAGVGQFGSGWAWIAVKNGKLEIMKTPNGENPLVHGGTPILGVDVWEHSYYIDYRNARPKYLEAFVDHLINWDYVLELYEKAS